MQEAAVDVLLAVLERWLTIVVGEEVEDLVRSDQPAHGASREVPPAYASKYRAQAAREQVVKDVGHPLSQAAKAQRQAGGRAAASKQTEQLLGTVWLAIAL